MHEVEERKEALIERETRLQAIISNAAEAIITVHEDRQVNSINEAAETMFGYSCLRAKKMTIDGLICADDEVLHEVFMLESVVFDKSQLDSTFPPPESTSRRRRDLDATGIRKNGKLFPAEFSASKVNVGGRRLITFIVRDVSERRAAERETRAVEREIRHLNEKLEQRVERRTADLKRANQELKSASDSALAASRAKDVFLANTSHELRTPLNAVIGFSEMLQEDAEAAENTETAKDLSRIRAAGKHLLSLINEILDLAKAEAGKVVLHIERFNPAAVVRQVADQMQLQVSKNGNQLLLEIADDVGKMSGDRKRLSQVLFNLLGNAAKFTENGQLTVTANRVNIKNQPCVRFSIVDTGIGMGPDAVEILFQPFSQVCASISKKYGGTGLGLSICRRICELMGGDIRVESEPGVGSTFTFWWPAVYAGPDEHDVAPAEHTEPNRHLESTPVPQEAQGMHAQFTVLAIDDDPAALMLISRHLSRAGYKVITAESGEDGIRMAQSEHPDAITLDAILPGIDGWHVLEALKSDPSTHEIPIIMVTMMDEQRRGYALGAADYLVKPIESDRLSSVLRRHLDGAVGAKVLVVDAEPNVRDYLADSMRRDGIDVCIADSLEAAKAKMAQNPPRATFVELLTSRALRMEFLTVLDEREDWKSIPVIVISRTGALGQLSAAERQRLADSTESVLLAGAYSRDELLAEVDKLVSRFVKRHHLGEVGK